MSTASYIAGTLLLILATITRSITVPKNTDVHESKIRRLLSIPSKDFPDDVYAAIGQLLGILWIVIGLFLAITENWFSSSAIGIIVEPLITFIPFIVGGITLKVLFSDRKR